VREYVLTLLVTAAVTYILTPLVRRGAIKGGVMHAARDRDVHVAPIPLLGGLAMYGGLAAGLLVASQMTPLNSVFVGTGTLSMETGLLLAGLLIVAMGIVDDRWGMSPVSKLAGQVAAGAILVASGCELNWLPLLNRATFSPTSNQAMVLTILVVVATINAVNFIDGLDGLAAGIVAIASVSFFLYYYWLTHVLRLSAEAQPALISAVLAGMCLGFLPHNFHPARIFMGDTGSMLLGLLLAYVPISSISSLDPLTLTSNQAYRFGTVNRFPEVLPLLLPTAILIIPYTDMLMAVFRRTRAGMSPFAPDRKHLHHRLLDIGHSHRSSVLIMYFWAALFSGAVVWLSIEKRPSWVFAMITVGAVAVLLLLSMPRLRWWSREDRRLIAAATVAAAPIPVPADTLAPEGHLVGVAADPATRIAAGEPEQGSATRDWPGAAWSAAGGWSAGEPSTGRHDTGQPSTGQSGTGQPSTGQPSTGQHSTGRHGSGGSGAGWPGVADPGGPPLSFDTRADFGRNGRHADPGSPAYPANPADPGSPVSASPVSASPVARSPVASSPAGPADSGEPAADPLTDRILDPAAPAASAGGQHRSVVGSIPPAAPHPVPLPPAPHSSATQPPATQPPATQPPATPSAAFGTGSDGQPAGPRWQRNWLASAASGDEPAADEALPPSGLPPAAPRPPAHGRPVRRPAPGGRVVPPPIGQDRPE
jgi:UDP-GlcNAc:undecaprenyl-phosphate GlcNAc-1-phosphate transferase